MPRNKSTELENSEVPKSAQCSYPSFDRFDSSEESFVSYLERFEFYLDAYNIPREKWKAILITKLGSATYAQLRELAVPETPQSLTYEALTTKLKLFFQPTPLTSTERFKLRNRKQQAGESFSEFLSDLQVIAMNCGFPDQQRIEEEIRDQIIVGIYSKTSQSYFLTRPTLSLKDVVSKALADEQAAKGVSVLNPGMDLQKISPSDRKKDTEKTPFSNNDMYKKMPSSEAVCYRCDKNDHEDNECRAKNLSCSYCQKQEPIEEDCLDNRHSNFKTKSNCKALSCANFSSERSDVSDILQLHTTISSQEKFMVRVQLNGHNVDMELDTGSAFSLMSLENFNKLILRTPIRYCNLSITLYSKQEITVNMCANLKVSYKNQNFNGRLYLVDEDLDTVLGRDWLHYLNLDWPEIKHNFDVNSTRLSDSSVQGKIKSLIAEYADIFKPEVGMLNGFTSRITLQPDCAPVFIKARTLPFTLISRVEEELDRLESLGILTPTVFSNWATPIVPMEKEYGCIRIRGDYKITINKVIQHNEYCLPNFEEFLASMGGCSYFSKFSIREAFTHMPVDDQTSELLTINTTKGLYKVNRLMYGIANAPAEWQRATDAIFKHPGILVFYDDVKIASPDPITHLERLKFFFSQCRKYNIRLEKEKCDILSNKIAYLGFAIDKMGLHINVEKIQTILEASVPSNVSELKTFIGLVTYYGRFVPDMATLLAPLYDLLKKDTEYNWSRACDESFQAIKKELSSDQVLTHYDISKPLILATDASAYGIGACLSHSFPDGTERPIAFASRRLTKVERYYSQLDKEALAIFWGVKKFFNYLYGRHFTLFTDHKSLQSILSNTAASPEISATRLSHYSLFLQGFNYTIKYKRSKDHANADFCSRFPYELVSASTVPKPTVLHNQQLQLLPVTSQMIARETENDLEMWRLKSDILNASLSYKTHLTSFTVKQGCILNGRRVFVPPKFRDEVLRELHTGHFGLQKMKDLALTYVYWPDIDKDIEAEVKKCTNCLQQFNNETNVPEYSWRCPGSAWHKIHINYVGPFMDSHFLIVVDAHTKWLEVYPTKSTTSAKTIELLQDCFSRFGLPVTLVSNNAPIFTSFEFETFLTNNCIKHIRSAPYYPVFNDQAEQSIQTVKKALRAMSSEPGTLSQKLSIFLLAYRKTDHAETGDSPSKLMFNRVIRGRMDLLLPEAESTRPDSKTAENFLVGDKVLFVEYNNNTEKWGTGYIQRKIGNVMFEIQTSSGIHIRHLSQLQKNFGVEN